MLDLILRQARLENGSIVDIGVKEGYIVEKEPSIKATAHRELNCQAHLLSPTFVDAHFHLDAALSLGMPRFNHSGTLLEGIQIWAEQKPDLKAEVIKKRAHQLIRWAIARGTLAIRTHVDICDPDLTAVHTLLDVKKEVAHYFTLQLVAFPQDGYFRDPKAKALLAQALDLGVDVVGGIPHFERTRDEGSRSIRALCELAADRGLRVDMHCDETDDPNSRHVETLAAETIRLGLQGRVTGSHLTSMHSMSNDYVYKLIPLLAEAQLHAVANPLINITLQGRQDHYPKRRGMMRVPELLNAGVNVSFGHDCVMDPWYGLGSADMLEVAHMGAHVGQMMSLNELRECFKAVTEYPAKTLGIEGYGIEIGAPANLVLLHARDPIEAIKLRAPRRAVISRGHLIAEGAIPQMNIDLPMADHGSAQSVVTFLESIPYPYPDQR